MLKLLMIREKLKEIYSTKSKLIDPAIRFVVSLISMIVINANIGAMNILTNPLVVLIISIIGALLPKTMMVMMILFVMIAHVASISLVSAIVVVVTYIIMYLLFFRFTSKMSYMLIAIPLLFYLNIPFVAPVLLGLTATPIAIVPMVFGTLIYFYLNYFSVNYEQLIVANADDAISMMANMATNVFKNTTFFYTVGVFAVVICLVYFVRKLSIDYSWMVSAVAGGLLATTAMLIGCIIFDMSAVYSIAGVIIGGILSTIIAWLVQMLVHSVDYSRTEYTQFEDDEYYYYVKAVPKVQVLPAEKSIKRINARKVNTSSKGKKRKK